MSETPAATLLMLTFNQEQFVTEAVRAALAQDYANLQILISDDCSEDRTFGAVEACVRDYQGPHGLQLRRTNQNRGLVPHFFETAALAKGELIVAVAGDDISYPDRVSRLVAHWRSSGADALCSDWDVIDDKGHVVHHGRLPGAMDLQLDAYFGGPVTAITGATAAYSAAVFRNIPRPPEPLFAEDFYLTLMLHWRRRKVVFIERALVGYRVHEQSATHDDWGRQPLLEQERTVEINSGRNASALSVFERLTRETPADDGWGQPVDVNRAAIAADIAFNRFRSGWLSASAVDRAKAFLRFRSPEQRRWLIPRLLGFRGLWVIKVTRSALRKLIRLR